MGKGQVGGVLAGVRGAGGGLGMFQLGPDFAPRLAAQIAPRQLAAGFDFDGSGSAGIHVPQSGEALIEVRLAHVQRCREFSPSGDGYVSFHSPTVANRFAERNTFAANRYVKPPTMFHSDLLETVPMETAADRRKRKLIELCDRRGRAVVAERAGLSSVALEQIIKGVLLPTKADGTRSPKSLGDKAARAIERAFSLGEGWFDASEPATSLSNEALMVAIAYDSMTRAEKMRLDRLMAAALDVPIQRQDVPEYMGGISGLGELDEEPAKKKG